MTEELMQDPGQEREVQQPVEQVAPATRYRVTVLTPTLLGDGQKLSPIDYMVWKDQVNVLNQRRIFRLLARGPRIESYLAQLRKSEKLDFTSWGGYAQNYALRRIAFDDPISAEVYAKTPAEGCFIPTFASGPNGIYFPASVLKGAIRLGMLVDRESDGQINAAVEGLKGENPRRASGALETAVLGPSGASRTRAIHIADSHTVTRQVTKVFLLRVATLAERGGKLESGWKGTSRGALPINRAADSTPYFAEMAEPGTVFEGDYRMPALFRNPEARSTFRWKSPAGPKEIARAVNHASTLLLQNHAKFAETANLPQIGALCAALLKRVEEAQAAGRFLTCAGWGTGILAKTIWAAASEAQMREGLRQVPGYEQALRTGLPFPKTRRLIVRNHRASSLPGWMEVELL
jgi:CRISPR-associated protein Csm5